MENWSICGPRKNIKKVWEVKSNRPPAVVPSASVKGNPDGQVASRPHDGYPYPPAKQVHPSYMWYSDESSSPSSSSAPLGGTSASTTTSSRRYGDQGKKSTVVCGSSEDGQQQKISSSTASASQNKSEGEEEGSLVEAGASSPRVVSGAASHRVVVEHGELETIGPTKPLLKVWSTMFPDTVITPLHIDAVEAERERRRRPNPGVSLSTTRERFIRDLGLADSDIRDPVTGLSILDMDDSKRAYYGHPEDAAWIAFFTNIGRPADDERWLKSTYFVDDETAVCVVPHSTQQPWMGPGNDSLSFGCEFPQVMEPGEEDLKDTTVVGRSSSAVDDDRHRHQQQQQQPSGALVQIPVVSSTPTKALIFHSNQQIAKLHSTQKSARNTLLDEYRLEHSSNVLTLSSPDVAASHSNHNPASAGDGANNNHGSKHTKESGYSSPPRWLEEFYSDQGLVVPSEIDDPPAPTRTPVVDSSKLNGEAVALTSSSMHTPRAPLVEASPSAARRTPQATPSRNRNAGVPNPLSPMGSYNSHSSAAIGSSHVYGHAPSPYVSLPITDRYLPPGSATTQVLVSGRQYRLEMQKAFIERKSKGVATSPAVVYTPKKPSDKPMMVAPPLLQQEDREENQPVDMV